jgi:hypothetical protein
MCAAQGCVPIPLVIPPVKVSMGAQAISKASYRPDIGGQFELGLYPYQFIEERIGREFDFGFGYRSSFGEEGAALMGPYAELATYRYPSGPQSWRLGVHGRAQLLSQSGPWAVEGLGVGSRVSVSYGGFSSGLMAECEAQSNASCMLGFTHGEGSIGVYVDGGLGFIGSNPVWQVTIGVEGRIPAIIGIIFVSLLDGDGW